jgi:AraC family transcriptional regulator
MMTMYSSTADIFEANRGEATISRQSPRAEKLDRRYSQFDLRSEFAPWKSAARGLTDGGVRVSPVDSVKRHSAGRHGMRTETIYAPSRTKVEFRFQGHAHLLVLYGEGTRRDGETWIDGLPPSRLKHLANKLTFVPADHAYYEWHKTTTPTRITFLYVAPAKLKKVDDGDATHVPRMLFDDSVIWETAAKLKAEIERGEPEDAAYLEVLPKLLGCELARSGQESTRNSTSRGGLAGWQMRAVASYVEEHLDEQITLAALAQVARLSQYHFCRAFKQSFGIPPRQYHLQRRMQWAKALLSERANSTTEVGLSLGYAQSGSFTVAFHRVTGQTPSDFRRSFS